MRPSVMSRRDPRSLGPSLQLSMGYTYVLRGFGCRFLEMRAITFVHQMLSVCICVYCGVVPSRSRPLSCAHILCDRCRDIIIARMAELARERRESPDGHFFRTFLVCPVDDTPIVEACLYFDPIPLHHVREELVLCLRAESGCPFQGKLKDLRDHYYLECPFGTKPCTLCDTYDEDRMT
ncbi:hypothetical protein HPB50_026809 [Hyalomma asiaticum]|uniref:Uncharacterized protein n=1 Tax=Hyalomma asiaticum TaxID=266040 RepID=A0ACB7S2B1_HYAAI|nr:hypothetical protein HPB50_026809 [Hyalomma asiaticum]